MLKNELATEPQSATSFLVLKNGEAEFNKVGTVLATECRLLLALLSVEEGQNPRKDDCHVILQVEAALFGRKVDRRVLTADVDAELWLISCVWNRNCQIARWPTPQRSRARAIPVGSVVDEVKTGGKEENSGVDGMILRRHTELLKHLEPMRVHWMKCDTQRETCAHACVR